VNGVRVGCTMLGGCDVDYGLWVGAMGEGVRVGAMLVNGVRV
jgi:hypothetical protein